MRTVCLKAVNVYKSFSRGFVTRRAVPVLEGISLEVRAGMTIGIAGESGTGKTTFGKILCGVEKPSLGDVYFLGKRLSELTRSEKREFRRNVQMMFQDPEGALNPVKTVGTHFFEVCSLGGIPRSAWASALEDMLDTVGLSKEILWRYPRQLSGGQNQRVALGRILLLGPQVLVLDEPTSALDISVQAQILRLLKDIQLRKNLAYVFISHDFDVLSFMCDEIGWLAKGRLRFRQAKLPAEVSSDF